MHKILIVDDERLARDFIADLVASHIAGAEVTKVDNAEKALDCMQTKTYDLLFVDIEMPGMNGLELLDAINRMGQNPYTVIVSAHSKIDYTIKGYELGVARYILKPSPDQPVEAAPSIVQHITKPLYDEKIYEAIRTYLNKTKTETIDLKVPNGVRRINMDDIVAIETVRRSIVKVYLDHSILSEVAHPLSHLHKQLPSNFSYISRKCIINLHKVKHFNTKLQSREFFAVCQDRECSFTASRKIMREKISLFTNSTINNDAQ